MKTTAHTNSRGSRQSRQLCTLGFLLWAAHAPAAPLIVSFREPASSSYELEITGAASARGDWIEARPQGAPTKVEFGHRLILRIEKAAVLDELLQGRELEVTRRLGNDLYVLEATSALAAALQAHQLAQREGVLVCCPVSRREVELHSPYARRPNDPYFDRQWYLEHRTETGSRAGPDLNARAAWALVEGQGVTVIVADNGVDLDHPDLQPNVREDLSHNFVRANPNGRPEGSNNNHGTPVAGLIAAAGNNRLGMIGVAPKAGLGSWVVYQDGVPLPSDETLMEMYQHRLDVVDVQNHSWGRRALGQLAPVSPLEDLGIGLAVKEGRAGKGTILVRSPGNDRESFFEFPEGVLAVRENANESGYASDPRVIAVGAIRQDGRVSSSSEPGACLLVAAPGSDLGEGFPGLFSTDRTGAAGWNQDTAQADLANYSFGEMAVGGTSAAAAQIAGIAALLLSANPGLTYRDVQQILIHSARHFDRQDPDLRTNGAGLLVSHNAGFGIPDAGVAARLAGSWKTRPPLEQIAFQSAEVRSIPDAGLRVTLLDPEAPESLRSIAALPSAGLHPDGLQAEATLSNAGLANAPLIRDLAGQAALIRRGGAEFATKIQHAADAGARFAILYNDAGRDELAFMFGTDFVPIPAVFISQNDGEALVGYLQVAPQTRVRLDYETARYAFDVPETLLCEHVAVRVNLDHPYRGDLRITLLSPQGTRSVLQPPNFDGSPAPDLWTYHSTHHFYESSRGSWTVEFGDVQSPDAGRVRAVELIISGVRIKDEDGDGLDDSWELAHFQSLTQTSTGDPDEDGYNNAQEQILGTEPAQTRATLHIDFSSWSPIAGRLSWPSRPAATYQVLSRSALSAVPQVVAELSGFFPEVEYFVQLSTDQAFYSVRESVPVRQK